MRTDPVRRRRARDLFGPALKGRISKAERFRDCAEAARVRLRSHFPEA
jgi:hypothetical protein